jgi:type I restriction enzyme S subunit
MPDDLPNGWTKTTLGQVCLPVAKINPESSDAEITYFDIGGIDNEKNRIAETTIIPGRDASSRARQALRKNDILFSTVRPYLKKIAQIEKDYNNPIASTGFAVIRCAEGISPQFVFFQVLSQKFLEPLIALQTGSSYPAVRASEVFAQSIVLAPTAEQERLSAKLRAALLAVERAEIAARRAKERLQRYRTSVLDAAVTGKLTHDWRQGSRKDKKVRGETGETFLQELLSSRRSRREGIDLKRHQGKTNTSKRTGYVEAIGPKMDGFPELPKGWAWASITQLSWASGYGTSAKCTHEGFGPAVLRIPNIKNGAVNFEGLKFAASFDDLNDDLFVTPGDLLLIRTNGSKELIGRAAVVRDALKTKSSFASYLIRFRLLGDKTLWSWVGLAWNSNIIRANIEARAATTAGQYNISLSGLADLAIPLPARAEQEEITREVQHRLAAADRLEITLDRQLERALATRESLLREAFAGRLVPQDPKDEPASVLLERVHAARKSEDQKPKAKRMPKATPKKRVATRRSLITVLKESGRSMTPEQLFQASGHSEDTVDEFFAELRDYTTTPAKIVEERTTKGLVRLKAVP